MSRRPFETSVESEVPFHHVDPLGVVWHGHYLKYMEGARTALLRGLGLDAGDLVGPRYRFVVVESRCRHVYPLRYGERLRATAWLTRWERRLDVAYEITNLSRGRRAARGHTLLATTDVEGRLLWETPRAILDRLRG